MATRDSVRKLKPIGKVAGSSNSYRQKNLKLYEQWEPDTMRSIAQKLARLHQTEIPIDKNPTTLQRIRDLVDKCNHSGVDLNPYKPYIKIVEDFLLTTNAEIGFCHND